MIYGFICDDETSGCGNVFEIECSMSAIKNLKPKCPCCGKKRAVYRDFGSIVVSVPKTLGTHAEKNARKMSEDYKTHLTAKYNEYRNKPFTGKLPEGLKTFDKDGEGNRIPTPSNKRKIKG